jgi:hypothetical protein
VSDRFHDAVVQIKAEEFFEEKNSSPRERLSPVDRVLLFKVAEEMRKQAEPPPPKGVTMKEWDRILSKGPKK